MPDRHGLQQTADKHPQGRQYGGRNVEKTQQQTELSEGATGLEHPHLLPERARGSPDAGFDPILDRGFPEIDQ